MAYNKNEVLDIPNSEKRIHGPADLLFQGMQILNRVEVGYPMGYFTGWDIDGIFQTQEEVQNYVNNGKVVLPNAKPGDVKFVDQNKDGKIDDADRIMLGSPHPKVTLGLNVSMSYKGFDFALSGYGNFGHQIAQAYRSQGRVQYNYKTTILDRWHGPGTSNKIPRVAQIDSNDNWFKPSPLFIKDASFFRLATITFGYDFTRLWKTPFQRLRVYVSASNLFTFTKYDGMDPKVGYDGGRDWISGIDVGYYPHPKVYNFGVNVTF